MTGCDVKVNDTYMMNVFLTFLQQKVFRSLEVNQLDMAKKNFRTFKEACQVNLKNVWNWPANWTVDIIFNRKAFPLTDDEFLEQLEHGGEFYDVSHFFCYRYGRAKENQGPTVAQPVSHWIGGPEPPANWKNPSKYCKIGTVTTKKAIVKANSKEGSKQRIQKQTKTPAIKKPIEKAVEYDKEGTI